MYIFHDQHSVDQFNKGQEKALREMRTRSTFFIRIKKKKLKQVLNLKEFNSSLHKKKKKKQNLVTSLLQQFTFPKDRKSQSSAEYNHPRE